MLHGPCRTSAEASHNLHLNRFLSFFFPKFALYVFVKTIMVADIFLNLKICFLDKACTTCSWEANSFEWWWNPYGCLLGIVISLWWYQWQDPSSDWCWGVPSACGTFAVSNYIQTICGLKFRNLGSKSMSNIAFVFCSHTSPSVLIPALRTVGNIVTGDDMQTQVRSTSNSCA